MRIPPTAAFGAGVVALSAISWVVGSALDGEPLDPLLGINPYLLAYFALPAGITGLTVATGAFALQRPLRLPWLWLIGPTFLLTVASVWLWAFYWRGYCCTV